MFQPPPRMSKLPSATLAASASSIVTLIRRSIADPGALARRARGPFLARRRRVRSALGHSARSASRRRRPRHGCGAPRRLGRRRASGAPHPASSPCECTTLSARTCMSGLGAPARRCPTTSGRPQARGRGDTRRAFIPNLWLGLGGWRFDDALGLHLGRLTDQAIGVFRGVGLPSPGSVLQMGAAPPFRAGRTSSAAAARGAQGTGRPRARQRGSPPR